MALNVVLSLEKLDMGTDSNRLVPDDTVQKGTRILEDHPNPLPICERCGIQVPEGWINNHHYTLDQCKQG